MFYCLVIVVSQCMLVCFQLSAGASGGMLRTTKHARSWRRGAEKFEVRIIKTQEAEKKLEAQKKEYERTKAAVKHNPKLVEKQPELPKPSTPSNASDSDAEDADDNDDDEEGIDPNYESDDSKDEDLTEANKKKVLTLCFFKSQRLALLEEYFN